jgi:predicted RND superfamily exporter protein
MIGFGSMSLASHTGIAIFGFTLFCGVGACFISSAYVLPAILSLMEKLTGKNRRSKKSPQSSKSDNVKTDTDENDQLKEETCA